MKRFCHLIIFLFFFIRGFSQTTPVEWRAFPIERLPPERRPIFYHVLCMSSGSVLLSSSHGLIRYQGFRLNFPSVGIIAGKNEKVPDEEVRDPHTKDGIRSICRGSGANFFFLTGTRRIYYVDESLISLTGWANPPLYIPITIEKEKTITSIWSDEEDDLFVGVKEDSLVIISGAATHSPSDGEMDSVGNFISKKIAGNTTKIFIPGYPEVYAFTKDLINPGSVLLSTSKGLMRLKKKTGEINYLGEKWADKIITTALLADQKGNIWFSTVNHGMGFYDIGLNKYSFYKGPVQPNKELTVSTFCKKSGNEFFVAIADSLPAIFNIDNHSFFFLEDTIFNRSKNTTTDIRMDGFGNLFVVKGGALFYTHSFSENKDVSGINLDSSAYAPFIYEFHINRRPYFELVKKTTILPHLKEI
ncbi:MAG TPA: hypothetical protein VJ765_01275, partial [Chitinophagaceae bacterium]|nr:hypothetical protein [Chitinophagaceae bacterium]